MARKIICDVCQCEIRSGAVCLRVAGQEHPNSAGELPEIADLCPDCLRLVPDLRTAETVDGLRRARIARQREGKMV